MSIELIGRVLERVDGDLAEGHTYLATQRLASLVRQYAADPAVRAKLAATHLRTCNLVEAGRWSYLADERDPSAVAAFERAHRHPADRLRALRWVAPIDAATPVGQERLRALRAGALTTTGRPTDVAGHAEEPPGSWWGMVVMVVVSGVILALLAIGATTVVRWLI